MYSHLESQNLNFIPRSHTTFNEKYGFFYFPTSQLKNHQNIWKKPSKNFIFKTQKLSIYKPDSVLAETLPMPNICNRLEKLKIGQKREKNC